MTEYLTVTDVLDLHEDIILETGGSFGLRDPGGLDSAIANPSRTFGGADLYPTLVDKGAILLWSLVQNHPFVDGNKRIGFGALELFLRLNHKTIRATVDDAEAMVLSVAAGDSSLAVLHEWLTVRIHDYVRLGP